MHKAESWKPDSVKGEVSWWDGGEKMERAGFYKTLHGTPPPSDKPRCVVCGDESSGIHYGVNSCEGCKGFFRRCMVKGMHQKCTNNEECEITRFARNSCQFCRLAKCVRVGMSRSASKVGRRPKCSVDERRPKTTSVLPTDVTAATEAAKNKATGGGRPVGGPRRSQSLVGSSSKIPGTVDLRVPVPTSPGVPRRGSTSSAVYERLRSNLEGLRTASPFASPYPTPCSSRTPSISGVDSWQETDESSVEQSPQVIDYSVGANYQGYSFQHRSPGYQNHASGNLLNTGNGNGSQFELPSSSGTLDQSGAEAHNWLHSVPVSMDQTSLQHQSQLSFSGNLAAHVKNSADQMDSRRYDEPSSSMEQAQSWQTNNTAAYQNSLQNATSSYYKDFYPNCPQ